MKTEIHFSTHFERRPKLRFSRPIFIEAKNLSKKSCKRNVYFVTLLGTHIFLAKGFDYISNNLVCLPHLHPLSRYIPPIPNHTVTSSHLHECVCPTLCMLCPSAPHITLQQKSWMSWTPVIFRSISLSGRPTIHWMLQLCVRFIWGRGRVLFPTKLKYKTAVNVL
jgi:hypothetical protein